jgi:hypothetical protein
MTLAWQELVTRCERTGLQVRGGFHPAPGEPLPDVGGAPASTVVLLGNVGPAMWEEFARARAARPELDGLDAWTRAVVSPLAAEHGARPIFPFEGPPYWPFQQWAQRAEPLHPSPLGILIHPTFGLWHAYRAALLFADRLPLPPRPNVPSPCATCADRPCLQACPVGAFSDAGYDVPACVAHLQREPKPPCMTEACLARRACPVGQEHVYVASQREHHMRAFLRPWSAGSKPSP